MTDAHICTPLVTGETQAPAGAPPAHTKFVVMVCPCGAVTVFPEFNYRLTTRDFQLGFQAGLAARGAHLKTVDPHL